MAHQPVFMPTVSMQQDWIEKGGVSLKVKNTEYGVTKTGVVFVKREGQDVVYGPSAFEMVVRDLKGGGMSEQARKDIRYVMGLKDVEFEYVIVDPRAQPPRRAHASDAGYDIVIIDIVKSIKPDMKKLSFWWRLICNIIPMTGEVVMYDTGLSVQPPHGYYFELVPRSSIIKSGYMLANSIGVIDSSYQGTIKVPLVKWAWWARDLDMPARMVQLVLRKQYNVEGQQVPQFHRETARGDGGFGSTGVGAIPFSAV